MSNSSLLPSLVGLSKDSLQAELELIGEKSFRAQQIWQWLYVKGVSDFKSMTNLSNPLRDKLAGKFSLQRPEIVTEQCSIDGTRKWLLRFPDRQEVEMVFIPDEERGTLCVSSQVGCTLTCDFCHTGTQKLVRNLTATEIVGQLCLARDRLEDWGKIDEKRSITNIVLMGMGEPLFNYDNVAAALKIMMDGEGISISRRKITLSTAGVVPLIAKVGEEIGVGLAISLHAVRDDLRNILVPLNKKYPLVELMEACRAYPSVRNARRITFEYVMLDSVNDSDRDAKELVRLIDGIPAKINLIPFNPWPGTKYRCSSPERIARFAAIVMDAGYPAPIRTPRGQDILAACGQLKSESIRLAKSARLELEKNPDNFS